jgi:hypothetical protein
MADTIRELILQDLATQAATIRTSGGYNTEVGANVFRGKMEFASPASDLPAVSILPEPDQAEKRYGKQDCVMPINVHALQFYGSNDVSRLAEATLGDLISCLVGGRAAYTSATVDEVVYTGGGAEEYPAGDEQVLHVRCSLEISYKTVLGDPYSQSS